MKLLGKLLGRTTSETFGWLETEQLTNLLTDVAPPVVIDVRGPEEFTGPLGHIETAENIPLDQVSVHGRIACQPSAGRWFRAVTRTGGQRRRRSICGARASPISWSCVAGWSRGGLAGSRDGACQ